MGSYPYLNVIYRYNQETSYSKGDKNSIAQKEV